MKFGLSLLGLLWVGCLDARQIIEGDWAWEVSGDDYNYAGTVNDYNHVLAQYCYISSGNCLYMISFNAQCDEGSTYPGVVNSDAGSAAIELVCSHQSTEQHVYIISKFDDIDLIIRNANKIGIAFPLQGDKFQVTRFSLRGSTKAINMMRDTTERMLHRSDMSDQEYL